MSSTSMIRSLLAIAILRSCCLAWDTPVNAAAAQAQDDAKHGDCIVNLNFAEDGVLPSLRGLAYMGTVPEQTAYSVSNGQLHLNTLAADGTAVYWLPNAYDPARSFVLEFRMKVYPGTQLYGVGFEVSDSVNDFELGFADNGLALPPPRNVIPFNTTDGFHTYRLSAPANSTAYQLFIDGVLVASEQVTPTGDPGQRFIFGDSSNGPNAQADIEYIRFCQAPRTRSVTIDIRPDAYPNRINPKSNGVIPVAVLTTTDFNAATVAPRSVRFGPSGTEAPPLRWRLVDVNHDGNADLLLFFATRQTHIRCGQTSAVLTGRTSSGQNIRGADSIMTVGCDSKLSSSY